MRMVITSEMWYGLDNALEMFSMFTLADWFEMISSLGL